jgi:hypothetical protein
MRSSRETVSEGEMGLQQEKSREAASLTPHRANEEDRKLWHERIAAFPGPSTDRAEYAAPTVVVSSRALADDRALVPALT